MIKYALVCENAHDFDSWFQSSAAFETQAKRGLVACPECGSAKVCKAIMAPSIARRDRQIIEPQGEPAPPAAPAPTQPVALLDERQQNLRTMVRALHARIVADTDDVGRRFPDEARRMHDGDIPHRSIRGEASLEDARALLEEGVEIMPIPRLPEEWN